MLEKASHIQQTNLAAQKTLTWVKNERMGGKVPVWTSKVPETAKEITQAVLSQTLQTNQPDSNFANALTDAGRSIHAPHSPEFKFSDILDMANPLQHIPVLNMAYRKLTGDEISPISRIVGGAAFGGPIGAIGNFTDIVLEEETGKNIAAHTKDIFAPAPNKKPDLNTQALAQREENTRTLLSFSDLSAEETHIAIKKQTDNHEKTATQLSQNFDVTKIASEITQNTHNAETVIESKKRLSQTKDAQDTIKTAYYSHQSNARYND
jgi:hypothetical protein